MASINDPNVMIYVERGQLNNLVSNDPILKDQELIAVYNEYELIGHKIGDGTSKWSELDYVDLDLINEFKVYDKRKGYICKIVLNPIDKIKNKYKE